MLVALARWTNGRPDALVRAIALALQSGITRGTEQELQAMQGETLLPLKDATAALFPGMPLFEALAKAKLSTRAVARARKMACEILAAFLLLGSWAVGRSKGTTGRLLKDHPPLAVVRRRIEHRFVLPFWAVTGRTDLGDAGIAGWGDWHPEIRTLDDLLAWATAHGLSHNAVDKVGKCDECGGFYVSARRGRHRFCSSDCRDRFWNSETGSTRTRKSREKRADGRGGRERSKYHVIGGRGRQPRS